MGTQRFTFGEVTFGGIHFLTALIGLFAVPQLVDNFSDMVRDGSAAQASPKLACISDVIRLEKDATTGGHRRTCRIIFILPGAGAPSLLLSVMITPETQQTTRHFWSWHS